MKSALFRRGLRTRTGTAVVAVASLAALISPTPAIALTPGFNPSGSTYGPLTFYNDSTTRCVEVHWQITQTVLGGGPVIGENVRIVNTQTSVTLDVGRPPSADGSYRQLEGLWYLETPSGHCGN